MKPIRSPLTDEERERAKTLHASGKSVYAVAKTLGRSPHTLAKFLRNPEVVRQVNVTRAELACMFDQTAQRALNAVSDADILKANLSSKLIAAGIAVDKAAILRGQATSTIDVHVLLDIASMIRGDRRNQSSLQNQSQSPPLVLLPENPK